MYEDEHLEALYEERNGDNGEQEDQEDQEDQDNLDYEAELD